MGADYNMALFRCKSVPSFRLGTQVLTPIGLGILVAMQIPFNGLYVEPEAAMCVVWFSTESAKGGFVSREFKLSEIKKFKNEESIHDLPSEVSNS